MTKTKVEIFHRYSILLDIKFKGSEIGNKKKDSNSYILNEFIEMMTDPREKKKRKKRPNACREDSRQNEKPDAVIEKQLPVVLQFRCFLDPSQSSSFLMLTARFFHGLLAPSPKNKSRCPRADYNVSSCKQSHTAENR